MLRSLLASTASNAARFLVATVITLIMTPIYIHELGNYDYGIWELLGSVVGYLGLLDLGLTATISRFTAYLREQARSYALFSTSMIMMTALGLLTGLLLLGWSLLFPGVLAPEDGLNARYALVIQLFAAHTLISFPYAAVESVFEGRLWYTTLNNVGIAHQIASACFLYVYLPEHDPLLLLILVHLIAVCSRFVILFSLLYTRKYGAHRLKLRGLDITLVWRMLRFGGKTLAQSVAGKASQRTDPVLIAIFLGPQKIVFFNLAAMLLNRINQLTLMIGHAFMPAFSSLHAQEDKARLEKYFFNGTKYIYSIQAGASLGAIVVGENFVDLWIGPGYGAEVRPLIWVLSLSLLIRGSLPLHNRLLTALNRHGRLAIIYGLRAALNLCLSIAFIPTLGLVGVAIATLVANTVCTPIIWRIVFRHLETRPSWYIRHSLLPVLSCAVLMAGAAGAAQGLAGTSSWLRLILIVIAGAVIYTGLILCFALSKAEKLWLLQRLRPLIPNVLRRR